MVMVEYIGGRTGGFTQHGESTRPYRFSPPYKNVVPVHPTDVPFFSRHPEFRIAQPVNTPAVRREVPTRQPQPISEAKEIQVAADRIKAAAQRAVARAAVQERSAPNEPPVVQSQSVPTPRFSQPEHPALRAQRVGRLQDMTAKVQASAMANQPASAAQQESQESKRMVGPLGNLRPAGDKGEPWRPSV